MGFGRDLTPVMCLCCPLVSEVQREVLLSLDSTAPATASSGFRALTRAREASKGRAARASQLCTWGRTALSHFLAVVQPLEAWTA